MDKDISYRYKFAGLFFRNSCGTPINGIPNPDTWTNLNLPMISRLKVILRQHSNCLWYAIGRDYLGVPITTTLSAFILTALSLFLGPAI